MHCRRSTLLTLCALASASPLARPAYAGHMSSPRAPSAGREGRALVRLHRVPGSYAIVSRPLQHGSAVFTNYDDSEAWQGRWTVGLRYRHCPVAPAGAIRLTVYRISGSQNVPAFLRRLPGKAVQYSHPVVDQKASDTPMWQFDAAPKGTFYYKIDVLSGQGCERWGIAATTN